MNNFVLDKETLAMLSNGDFNKEQIDKFFKEQMLAEKLGLSVSGCSSQEDKQKEQDKIKEQFYDFPTEDSLSEVDREMAVKRQKEQDKINPLAKYSTTQLKAELRRRKKEY
jgi:hypothetical protein